MLAKLRDNINEFTIESALMYAADSERLLKLQLILNSYKGDAQDQELYSILVHFEKIIKNDNFLHIIKKIFLVIIENRDEESLKELVPVIFILFSNVFHPKSIGMIPVTMFYRSILEIREREIFDTVIQKKDQNVSNMLNLLTRILIQRIKEKLSDNTARLELSGTRDSVRQNDLHYLTVLTKSFVQKMNSQGTTSKVGELTYTNLSKSKVPLSLDFLIHEFSRIVFLEVCGELLSDLYPNTIRAYELDQYYEETATNMNRSLFDGKKIIRNHHLSRHTIYAYIDTLWKHLSTDIINSISISNSMDNLLEFNNYDIENPEKNINTLTFDHQVIETVNEFTNEIQAILIKRSNQVLVSEVSEFQKDFIQIILRKYIDFEIRGTISSQSLPIHLDLLPVITQTELVLIYENFLDAILTRKRYHVYFIIENIDLEGKCIRVNDSIVYDPSVWSFEEPMRFRGQFNNVKEQSKSSCAIVSVEAADSYGAISKAARILNDELSILFFNYPETDSISRVKQYDFKHEIFTLNSSDNLLDSEWKPSPSGVMKLHSIEGIKTILQKLENHNLHMALRISVTQFSKGNLELDPISKFSHYWTGTEQLFGYSRSIIKKLTDYLPSMVCTYRQQKQYYIFIWMYCKDIVDVINTDKAYSLLLEKEMNYHLSHDQISYNFILQNIVEVFNIFMNNYSPIVLGKLIDLVIYLHDIKEDLVEDLRMIRELKKFELARLYLARNSIFHNHKIPDNIDLLSSLLRNNLQLLITNILYFSNSDNLDTIKRDVNHISIIGDI